MGAPGKGISMESVIAWIMVLIMSVMGAQPDGSELLYYSAADDGVAVDFMLDDCVTVEIPEQWQGSPVVRIGDYAFAQKTQLSLLTIPDTVTSISEKAFEGSEGIRLRVTAGSYAEQYAKEHGMEYEFADTTDEELYSQMLSSGVTPMSSGREIAALQRLLCRAGYLSDENVDGSYSQETRDAVAALQMKIAGIRGETPAATGFCDRQTLVCLVYEAAFGPDAQAGTVSPLSAPADIERMQRMLNRLSLLEAAQISGQYDLQTGCAVYRFQERVNAEKGENALAVNGICDAQTMVYLEYLADAASGGVTPANDAGSSQAATVSAGNAQNRIAAGALHTVGLNADGTTVAAGYFPKPVSDVEGMGDIIAVGTGWSHLLCLKSDGTLVAAGLNQDGQCDVSQWTDLVAAAGGGFHTVGLRSNGTVLATGRNDEGQCDTAGWTGIAEIAAGMNHTVGLKQDGTVLAAGRADDGQCDIEGWTNIVSVAAGGSHTIGLKADGTVAAAGANDRHQCDTAEWTDVIAVAAGQFHTVALRADGTVVATGSNDEGQCDVAGWTDIVAVAAGRSHTVGLKSDGTVVATGWNDYGQCEVSGWDLF